MPPRPSAHVLTLGLLYAQLAVKHLFVWQPYLISLNLSYNLCTRVDPLFVKQDD